MFSCLDATFCVSFGMVEYEILLEVLTEFDDFHFHLGELRQSGLIDFSVYYSFGYILQEILRRKSRAGGVPITYVIVVCLIGILLGYLLKRTWLKEDCVSLCQDSCLIVQIFRIWSAALCVQISLLLFDCRKTSLNGFGGFL